MKIARVRHAQKTALAVVGKELVHILPLSDGMVTLIEAGAEGLAEVNRALAAGQCQAVPHDQVKFLAPLDRFGRDVLCTGWNYYDHFTESIGKREGQEVDRPKAPTFFTKAPDVVIGPYDDIAFDERISRKWDYEAEIAVVIGGTGRSLSADEAMDYVWGYCLANDISARDLQRRHGGQWLKGKSLDGTMPLGPWIVTPDEIDLPSVRLQCLLNGRIMQDAVAGQMAYGVAELLAELSLGMSLHAGDLLLMGTPSGIGNAREPQVFLRAGDVVQVRASGLGELHNRLSPVDLYGQSTVKLEYAS